MSAENNRSGDLLLHVCCGPCAEYPLTVLLEQEYKITAYFYNPNIHPQFEEERRRKYAAAVMKARNIPLIVDREDLISQWENKTWCGKYPNRCEMCYSIRLNSAAMKAAERSLSSFTTTLLVSPYQNREAICRIGDEAGQRYGVRFLDFDFRPGFRKGQEMAKEDGLYRQKYCGCIDSLSESKFRDKIYASFEGSEGETKTVL